MELLAAPKINNQNLKPALQGPKYPGPNLVKYDLQSGKLESGKLIVRRTDAKLVQEPISPTILPLIINYFSNFQFWKSKKIETYDNYQIIFFDSNNNLVSDHGTPRVNKNLNQRIKFASFVGDKKELQLPQLYHELLHPYGLAIAKKLFPQAKINLLDPICECILAGTHSSITYEDQWYRDTIKTAFEFDFGAPEINVYQKIMSTLLADFINKKNQGFYTQLNKDIRSKIKQTNPSQTKLEIVLNYNFVPINLSFELFESYIDNFLKSKSTVKAGYNKELNESVNKLLREFSAAELINGLMRLQLDNHKPDLYTFLRPEPKV